MLFLLIMIWHIIIRLARLYYPNIIDIERVIVLWMCLEIIALNTEARRQKR